MNELFSDWHRRVSVDLAGIDWAARQAAADLIAAEITAHDVAVLTAFAYSMPVSEQAKAWLRAPFKAAEPAFPMVDNDPELQMLAAAVLEQVCRNTGSVQLFACYSVRVAEHRGWNCPLPEVSEAAAAAINALAVSQRQPHPRPQAKRPLVLTKAVKEAVDALPGAQYPQLEPTKALFEQVSKAAQVAVDTAMTHFEAVAQWAEGNAQLASEETALLWWLLSGSSETLGAPWASLPTRLVAVVAGRELASVCVTMPAPTQSEALLQQLLAVNPRPKKPVSEALPVPLDVPDQLQFLIKEDLAGTDGDAFGLAMHSLDQSMLLRAWSELE